MSTTTAPRRVYRTAQIKPATRDAIKDVLASAADALTAKQHEADGWRELAEREPEEAAPARFSPLAVLLIGIAIGGLLGWLL